MYRIGQLDSLEVSTDLILMPWILLHVFNSLVHFLDGYPLHKGPDYLFTSLRAPTELSPFNLLAPLG